MSAICARLTNKGKVGVQRGRKTAGCPSFLPPPRGAARSRRPQTANPHAEVQRKTLRPERDEHACAVRVPRAAGAEKCCLDRANSLRGSSAPAQPVLKKGCRPDRANPPAAVRVPQSSGAGKRSRPVRPNPSAAVRMPRSTSAGKRRVPPQ